MDKSLPNIRIDSPKWEKNFKGSRATKSIDSAKRMMNLRNMFHCLNDQLEEYSNQLSCIMKKRDIVANRILTLLETLRYASDCHKHSSNVCKKLDEKINTATLELRDGNLNSEREEYLQETIETLTEIREEHANTEDIKRIFIKCQLYEAQLNSLKASKTHLIVHEKMVEITESRKKVLDEIRDLAIGENIEEELEDLILN